MDNSLFLYNKLENLPQRLQIEVSHFIDYLIEKTKKSDKVVIPKFGCVKGKIKISSDFDAPINDFKEYI